jgi:Flp pilus assembly protein TadD
MTERRIALAVAAGTLALFARSAGNGFVSLDDPSYILENAPVRRGLTLSGAVWAFTTSHSFNWHPLTWLSHMLDVTLFGVEPAGHHLVSAALHAANAALLFLALRRMSGARWPSALAAALFAVHPLRVESVAWAAERKDVLSGLFFMLALLAHARYAERPGAARYAAVFAALALGLLCKPMLVTLPAVLLLLDLWPLRRSEPLRRLVGEKLPLVALCTASAAITVLAQRAEGSIQSLERISLAERVANALVASVAYLRLAVWPSDLAVFYPHPALLGRAGELALPALGAALVLAALTAWALVAARRRPYLAVGWGWYLVTLAPVIGVVQVGAQAMADRYTYLPLIGIGVAVAWGARDLARRFAIRPAACAAAAMLVLGAFAVQTWRQIGTWRDSETLYLRAVRATQDNYVAHASLGMVYRGRGDAARAREQLELALAAKPDYALARVELGTVRAQTGDLEGAAAEHEQVLRAFPEHPRALNALGLVRMQQGRLEEAAALFERAVAAAPAFAEAHNNLGVACRRRGDLDAAVRHFRRALALRPDAEPPRANLRELGQPVEARPGR